MAARAILMYVALIGILRAGKKRALGGATVFDVVLVIVLGSIGARAIVGGAPFFPALLSDHRFDGSASAVLTRLLR